MHLVWPTRIEWHESNPARVLPDHTSAVSELLLNDVAEQAGTGRLSVRLPRRELLGNLRGHERERIDLTVRVRQGHADDRPLVFEWHDVLDVRTRGEINRTVGPDLYELIDLFDRPICEGTVMIGGIEDNLTDTVCRSHWIQFRCLDCGFRRDWM